jgi:hypothetical protein
MFFWMYNMVQIRSKRGPFFISISNLKKGKEKLGPTSMFSHGMKRKGDFYLLHDAFGERYPDDAVAVAEFKRLFVSMPAPLMTRGYSEIMGLLDRPTNPVDEQTGAWLTFTSKDCIFKPSPPTELHSSKWTCYAGEKVPRSKGICVETFDASLKLNPLREDQTASAQVWNGIPDLERGEMYRDLTDCDELCFGGG